MNTLDFMTKTAYIDRQDTPPKEGVYLIAIDIGYSAVKCMSENTASVFPSFAIPDTGLGTIGDLTDDFIRYKNLKTGEKWFVGKMATSTLSDDDTSISESSLYRRDRYSDPMFRVIAETGLGLACIKDDSYKYRKIHVQTGLPPRYLNKGSYDRTAMLEILGGHHHFQLKIGQHKAVEFEMMIDPKSVGLMPQPMGTLFSAAVMDDHKMTEDAKDIFNSNVIIFDGGFGTLDMYPIKSHKIQHSETFDHLGMKRVLEETTEEIRSRYRKEISVPAMQNHLESGTFRWFEQRTLSTKEEPLAEILEENSKKICDEAISKMFQVYPVYEYDYMIITGGTGAAWYDRISEKLKKMETLKLIRGSKNDTLPQIFANVRGYYQYLYSGLVAGKEE